MYHTIDIEKLTPVQISKLLNHHRVRVKHGKGHSIHVSEEQHKKIMKAFKKGMKHTMQCDPYQVTLNQHLRGKGMIEDLDKPLEYFNQAKSIAGDPVRIGGVNPINKSFDVAKNLIRGLGRKRMKKGGDLVNSALDFATKIGHEAGEKFKDVAQVNPFDLGYTIGHKYLGPLIVGKGATRRGCALNPAGYGLSAPVRKGKGLSPAVGKRAPTSKRRGRGSPLEFLTNLL